MFVKTQCEIHGTEYRIHKTPVGLFVDSFCGECEAERPFDPTEYYYPRESIHVCDLDANENENWDDED